VPLLKFPRFQLPPSPAALGWIALAFVLPGLVGHDPWKSHDALGIGVAWEIARSGDPIVPRIADLAWLSDPPFYHWLAAALGQVLQPLLEFHAGARLASGLFMLAALWLLHIAARDWSLGEERSATTSAGAPLLLLGSVGLIVHAHEALPELPALAAMCGALAVLPHATRRPVGAGALFGVSLGFGFLSSLWLAPAALGVAVLAAHFVCDEWRTRRALPFLLPAFLVAAAISVSWPIALYLRSGELFSAWWRITAQPHGAPLVNLKYFFSTLSWFAWPAWPLALWAGWALRGRLRDPRVFVPAVSIWLMLTALAFWGPPNDVNLIPLLAPLAFLASQGIPTLRRGAAAALDWFGVVTFACCAILVWLGYFAMLTGVPPKIAANLGRAAPGFVAQFQILPLLVALLLTVGWVYVVFFTAPAPIRSVLRWAAGIVLLWGTVAMLWMPWVDYQKSYRSVALKLRAGIPPGSGCIAAISLGVPQAAALHYHAGIRTRPYDPLKPKACPLVIVQGSPQHEIYAPAEGWTKIAEAGRPGDRSEIQRLYRLKK
jgi:4-amino-4-deoxy-L-arabinose transferase-like glycosyltransferase